MNLVIRRGPIHPFVRSHESMSALSVKLAASAVSPRPSDPDTWRSIAVADPISQIKRSLDSDANPAWLWLQVVVGRRRDRAPPTTRLRRTHRSHPRRRSPPKRPLLLLRRPRRRSLRSIMVSGKLREVGARRRHRRAVVRDAEILLECVRAGNRKVADIGADDRHGRG
jgi:hypothetical protein